MARGEPEEAEAGYDSYEWYNVREWSGPRGPGSGGKGRSRRERELRTNRFLPAGHERKIAQKLRNSQAKQRRREQRGPRSARAGTRRSGRASEALGPRASQRSACCSRPAISPRQTSGPQLPVGGEPPNTAISVPFTLKCQHVSLKSGL